MNIRDAFPGLAMLQVVRDPKESSGVVKQDFSNFDQEVVASLPEDWVYVNEDPRNKEFSDNCRPALSFRAGFVLGTMEGAADLSVQVSIGSNGRNLDNVTLHLAPEFESEEVARKLLDIAVSYWTPHHATVTRSEVDNLLRQPIGDVRIGWLTYFSNADVLNHLSPKHTANGFKSGALVQVNDGPISAANGDGVERIRKVIEELEPTGLLQNPKKKVR
ncbi:hypothetical protein EKH80_05280 [Dyella choica]|uniref:Immunity protein 52 domain-containing protein n=2 Tax=Dyella choica TaxID=1927959 RepID=A0A3S0R5C4_9GAMM|nr:hypothetical protein EKH80_05280 [Dyella choica]